MNIQTIVGQRLFYNAIKAKIDSNRARYNEIKNDPKSALILKIGWFDRYYTYSDSLAVYKAGEARKAELAKQIHEQFPEEAELLTSGLEMGENNAFRQKYCAEGVEPFCLLKGFNEEFNEIGPQLRSLFETTLTDQEIDTYLSVKEKMLELSKGIKNYGYRFVKGGLGPSTKESHLFLKKHGNYGVAISRKEEDTVDQIVRLYMDKDHFPIFKKVREQFKVMYPDFSVTRFGDMEDGFYRMELRNGDEIDSNVYILVK